MPEKEKTPSWIGQAADQIRVPAEDYTRIYANNFVLAVSNWDAALTFGEIVGEKDGKPVIEEKVKVTMSMPHAKAIHQLLGVHLALYEQVAGEIKIPDLAKLKAASTEVTEVPLVLEGIGPAKSGA